LAVARQTGAIVLGEFQIRSGDNFVIFRSGACPGQCHRERNGEAAKRQIHRCCPSADLPRRCGLGNIQALRGARKTGLARDVVDGSGSAAEVMVRTGNIFTMEHCRRCMSASEPLPAAQAVARAGVRTDQARSRFPPVPAARLRNSARRVGNHCRDGARQAAGVPDAPRHRGDQHLAGCTTGSHSLRSRSPAPKRTAASSGG